MLKQLRNSFSKSSSTSSFTSAPTPVSNLPPPPTSTVSVTKQLHKARTLYEEGLIAYESEQYNQAYESLQKAVRIQELNLGKYHEETIRSYWRLGRAACKSELEESKEKKKKRHVVLQAFQRAARMGFSKAEDAEYNAMLQDMRDCFRQAFLQQESGLTVSTCNNSDSSDSQSINSNNSSSHWSADEQVLKQVHVDPMKHMLKVFELEQKGDACVKKKNYKKAAQAYSQALQLQDALLGADSLDGADIRCKLALCFLRTNSTPQARRALQMAYTCFVQQVGTEHPATLGAVARMKKLAMSTTSSTKSLTSVGSSVTGGF